MFSFAPVPPARRYSQAHKTYNVIERVRNKLELPEDGIFSEDVPLPNVAALVAKEVGQGDDMVCMLLTVIHADVFVLLCVVVLPAVCS